MTNFYGQYPLFDADRSTINATPPGSLPEQYGLGPEMLMYPWLGSTGGIGGGVDLPAAGGIVPSSIQDLLSYANGTSSDGILYDDGGSQDTDADGNDVSGVDAGTTDSLSDFMGALSLAASVATFGITTPMALGLAVARNDPKANIISEIKSLLGLSPSMTQAQSAVAAMGGADAAAASEGVSAAAAQAEENEFGIGEFGLGGEPGGSGSDGQSNSGGDASTSGEDDANSADSGTDSGGSSGGDPGDGGVDGGESDGDSGGSW
tara:strand:+ start:3497 stop:4285 length:789 start_codon:yes stop_codon:yes gene_type:complete